MKQLIHLSSFLPIYIWSCNCEEYQKETLVNISPWNLVSKDMNLNFSCYGLMHKTYIFNPLDRTATLQKDALATFLTLLVF